MIGKLLDYSAFETWMSMHKGAILLAAPFINKDRQSVDSQRQPGLSSERAILCITQAQKPSSRASRLGCKGTSWLVSVAFHNLPFPHCHQ